MAASMTSERKPAGRRFSYPESGEARATRWSSYRASTRLSMSAGYSLFVGVMKVLLPATATVFILLLLAWPELTPGKHGLDLDLSALGITRPDDLTMLNARFNGFDSRNQPFLVTADVASQVSENDSLVVLELPKADMTLEDGTWLAITAKSGRYHRKAEYVELHGDVVLFHDKGFEVRTDSALIDLDKGTARGSTPVDGQGPLGLLNSEGFRLTEQGERIFFTGKSRMVVFPDPDEAGQ